MPEDTQTFVLLDAKSGCRIDAGRAACRKIGGHGAHGQKDREYDSESGRVQRCNTEQQTTNGKRSWPSENGPHKEAGENHGSCLPKNDGDYAAPGSSLCEADAEFARAQADGIGDRAEQAERRQK